PTVSLVDVMVQASRINYSSHAFSAAFTPGQTRNLTVTVRNSGVLPLTGVTAELISGSPFVSVDTETATYPNIAVGGTGVNTASPFVLTANSLTFPGHQAPMTLVLTGNGGFADTVHFNAAVGTASSNDPCGPDGYGYFAYDNTDASYELHPTYNYVDISSGLGIDLNLDDPGEKTVITSVFCTARALPFTFQYYGVEYDTITINANGWIAFGNQSWADHFRNYPIPAQSSARAMIAPLWDDMKTNGSGQGVWYYHDTVEDRVIIQWKGTSGSGWTAAQNFEVILYGQTETPTLDGNGRILIQYNDVTMNTSGAFGTEISGSSVGIQDESQQVGLQLAYRTTYSPGCATIVDGRAILITTDARALFGTLVGTVTDAANGQPMQDVRVSVDGFSYNDFTDANGEYMIENVLIGEYTVRAHKDGFNDATVSEILVELDSTETVNFSMLHPEMDVSSQTLTIAYPAQSSASFDVINDGNGPLDYVIRMEHTIGGQVVENWDALQMINISDLTGDFQMLGCEFVGDYWFVSGGASPTGTNWIYRFDRDGNEITPAIPQPSVSPFGWYDMAWDGNYLYGSEDGTGTITGIDLNGNVMAQIPSPLNPTRAIAYDPALERFWVADFTQNIYSIDRDGNVFTQIVNDGPNELAITGLAWWPQDPEGYKLYVFSRDGGTNQTRVTRIHPTTFDRQTVASLEGAEYTAGGCTVVSGYDDLMVTFGGILQNTSGDKLGVYQVKFNDDWATIAPAQATVNGGESREVTLNANFAGFRTDVHTVSLFVSSAVLDQEIEIPVTLDVSTAIGDEPTGELLPLEYALKQNYPNPFNPTTTIGYSLKQTTHARLSIFNIAGQEVARLVDGIQQSGAHTVQFDAAGLPSGMYIYRLQAGDFSHSAKMILLK
ncbi:MAG: carboxypeptidase regulatory-like domain-containing protein, partial [Calditrichaeota bacterium]|nr:carboxypeptidase regulatory-like domain-containing protein [Calditrichota bacterium]